jgi:hypothetical protein
MAAVDSELAVAMAQLRLKELELASSRRSYQQLQRAFDRHIQDVKEAGTSATSLSDGDMDKTVRELRRRLVR